MHAAIVIPAAAVLLSVLLVLEWRQLSTPRLVVKSLLSCLFVAAALAQPRTEGLFFPLLLGGLVLCLFGDVSLALPGKKAFLAGLVFFLLGHVAYAVAFFTLAPVGPATLIGALGAATLSSVVFRWLRPRLGKMLVPVAVYVVAISVMVVAASSVAGHGSLPVEARATVLAGAIAFYLSDLFVARQRFVREGFVNRLVGLPLYYVGQFLLAFSLAFVG